MMLIEQIKGRQSVETNSQKNHHFAIRAERAYDNHCTPLVSG